MNQTRSIFGDPGRIAPSVEKGWRDDFIVELRLLSVPGDQIGDELMTVETHVAESNEPAAQAFGEAKLYAREIAAATGAADHGETIGPATVVSTVLGLLGMLVTARAFSSWLDGGPVEVTAGGLIGLGVLLTLTSTLFFTRILRVIVEHPVLALLLPALLTGVFVGIFLLLSEPLLDVSTLWLGAAGALMLAVGTAVLWFGGQHDADEITAPGKAPDGVVSTRLVSALVLPLMTGLVLAFIWTLHALTT